MRFRILCVGADVGLLASRQALLASRSFDSQVVKPEEFDQEFQSGRFDLVILSATLNEEAKRRIQGEIQGGTKMLVLESLVWPEEFVAMVGMALDGA
jgi:hypothetical protein